MRFPIAGQVMFEVALLAVAWQTYQWGRFLVRDQEALARANATRLHDFESLVGLDHVGGAQHLVLWSEPLVRAVNHYYVYTHIGVTVAVLAWLFFRHRGHYETFRSALVLATGAGLAIHALFPLAPPRLMAEMGAIDTLSVYGPGIYSRNEVASITNQFAAMPSFHVGWAVFAALVVVTASRSPWRWLAWAHPCIMCFSVMATGNHYITDGVVGGALVVGAVYVLGPANVTRPRLHGGLRPSM